LAQVSRSRACSTALGACGACPVREQLAGQRAHVAAVGRGQPFGHGVTPDGVVPERRVENVDASRGELGETCEDGHRDVRRVRVPAAARAQQAGGGVVQVAAAQEEAEVRQVRAGVRVGGEVGGMLGVERQRPALERATGALLAIAAGCSLRTRGAAQTTGRPAPARRAARRPSGPYRDPGKTSRTRVSGRAVFGERCTSGAPLVEPATAVNRESRAGAASRGTP